MAEITPSGRNKNRIDRAAQRWVMRMIDDPDRHGPALDAWLARDPDHARAYQAVSRNVDAATCSAARINFSREALATASRRSTRSRRSLTIVAIAAMVAIGALIHPSTSPFFGETGDRMATATFVATNDAPRTIQTADGSILALSPGSLVDIDLDGHRRTVQLRRGRARFTVAPDHARPFVVTAGGGTITATGTMFEVAIGAHVEVRLLEGSVDVVAPGTRRVSHMRAGETLQFSIVTPDTNRPTTGPSSRSPNMMRSFDNVPLEMVLAEVNRGPGPRIMLADPSLGEQRMFLEIDTADRSAIAEKLALLLDLERAPSPPDTIVLRSRPKK